MQGHPAARARGWEPPPTDSLGMHLNQIVCERGVAIFLPRAVRRPT